MHAVYHGWVCGWGWLCLFKGQIPLILRWRCFCPSGRDIPKELEGLQRSFEEKTVTWRIYWCALVYVDLYSFIWFMLIYLIYVDLCWFMLIHVDLCWCIVLFGEWGNGFWLHIKSASPFSTTASQLRSEFEVKFCSAIKTRALTIRPS